MSKATDSSELFGSYDQIDGAGIDRARRKAIRSLAKELIRNANSKDMAEELKILVSNE